MKNEVLKQINANPELASKALNAIYRDKTFVVVDGNRVETFKKTKRGAESYIKRQQSISYYDDYTQSMVTCGNGLQIVEIKFTEISNPQNDVRMWYQYIKDLFTRSWLLNDVLYLAKRLNVSDEIMKLVTEMIKEIKETGGYTHIEEYEETEEMTENKITEQKKQPETKVSESDQTQATYKLNEEKNGVEIYFDEKPSSEVLETLKAHGFRWSKYKKCWYAKQSDQTISLAEQLANNELDKTITNEITYPDINIDDIHEYTIDKDLQKREHDANWIFRTQEKDYTKEIQETFLHYNNLVKDILNEINNPYYQYKIKKALQSFKKKYHELYIKWLSQKASCPHWAVTGRGNLNARSYNKKQERANNTMLELAALPEQLEKTIKHYKYKAMKEKQQAEREKAKNTKIDITFTTETKEFTYMGIKEKKRCYIHGDYWICKLWGCYRIFKHDKEIYECKSYDKLDDAKKYVCYLIQKEQKPA
jgi:hypothetical protein